MGVACQKSHPPPPSCAPLFQGRPTNLQHLRNQHTPFLFLTTYRHAAMIPPIHSLFALTFCALTLVHAQYPAELVGTWTTKSKKVLTGPVCLASPTD